MTGIYIDRSRLHKLADAIVALEPCPFTGTITRDQIVVALGEYGNIWPDTILTDVICLGGKNILCSACILVSGIASERNSAVAMASAMV